MSQQFLKEMHRLYMQTSWPFYILAELVKESYTQTHFVKVLKYKHKRENLQVPRSEEKKLPTRYKTSLPQLACNIHPETMEQLGKHFPTREVHVMCY